MGIDLGGTWLRAVVLRDGRVVRRVRRAAHGGDLVRLVRSLTPPRARPTSLVIAARGVWTPSERVAARRRLARLADRVEVISDVEGALLGALGQRPGVLVLAGTGSIVLGQDARGRLARAGGLGPLIGDEGSAFWLGREWLRSAPDAARLARRLARRPDAVARIAALAPTVLREARRGRAGARAIVAEGQRRLAAHAADVIGRLRLTRPVSVSWSGSLLADGWYRAGVRRVLDQRVRCRWRPPESDAALAVARRAAAR
ncbi:MAG TPA: BadF/BadG/BcrA/BcrD ATPase family protein [Methylomirabilota bacterium]|nr:BadF/BadG/BcrA/BcrD ATPase family protein [Methylomirabilota bacterium]